VPKGNDFGSKFRPRLYSYCLRHYRLVFMQAVWTTMPSQENQPFCKERQTAFWLNRISLMQLRGITRREAGDVDRLAHAGSIIRRARMLTKDFIWLQHSAIRWAVKLLWFQFQLPTSLSRPKTNS
jgi:hypothetical protein